MVAEAEWCPFVKGASGRVWFEPLTDTIRWQHRGLELKVSVEHNYGNIAWKISNESYYFGRGIAFTMIGTAFAARAHRYPSVIGDKGSSVYPDDIANTLCVMNRSESRHILESLNPTVSFQVGDVNRLAMTPINRASEVLSRLDADFSVHESACEPSVEFKSPGTSPWRYAQTWAQLAVDRPDGEPLPPYEPEHSLPAPICFVSFGVGVALGRFGANREGILDKARASGLPEGILFMALHAFVWATPEMPSG
jgi:hypothetical protein